MTEEQKANIILKEINEYVSIPAHMEKYYIKAVMKALKQISQQEK